MAWLAMFASLRLAEIGVARAAAGPDLITLDADADLSSAPQIPSSPAPGRTFGNGVNAVACNSTAGPVAVLNYTLSADAAYGVMTHFWDTGERYLGTGSDYGSDDIVLDYYVDGEEGPSISFQPAKACGQFYAGPLQAAAFPPYGLFAAGEMGKNGEVAGWYHYYKVPFRRSIRIEVRTLHACQVVYVVVRGHEVPKGLAPPAGLEVASGIMVPPNARLQLHRLDGETFQPLSFVPILNVPAGYAGLLLQATVGLETSPARNDYVEGCWHLYQTASEVFPGTVLGTGLEDFFDSSYWFCSATTPGQQPCTFAHPSAGLLHFDRSNSSTPGTTSSLPALYERLSAYRFFNQEAVGFRDGGRLDWRVGDVNGKCNYLQGSALGNPRAVLARSYLWVYTWPLNDSQPPAPNCPPIA